MDRPTSRYRASTVLLAVVVAGCGGAEAGGSWGGRVEDLPNGAVRVVNPPEGLWEHGGAWRLVPDLVLGAIEGPEPELFASVSGLAVDDAGRIYVLDRQTNDLRIFSAEGEHVRTVGRTGGGPGEYRAANGLVWMHPDTLLVVDQRGNRYSILTKEGAFARSVPRRLTFYGWAFDGGFDGDRVYERSAVQVGEEWYPVLLGTVVRGPGVGAVPVDSVRLPRSDAPLYEAFEVRTDRGGMMMSVPFTPNASYHLMGDGSLWHGHGSAFRLFRSTLAGDTLVELVLEGEPTAVTSEELEEWASGTGPERFRELGGDLDMDRIPDVKPYFDGAYRDPDGYLWLSVPAGPDETVFAVVDPEFRYLGRLVVPGVDRTEWVPPVVRAGRLHIVGTDDLDVERVYTFRIER